MYDNPTTRALAGFSVALIAILLLASCDIVLPIPPSGPKPPEVYTPLPTQQPVRDVEWLADVISSTKVMTITALDSPEVQVVVDEPIRTQMLKALIGHTQADVLSEARNGSIPPFPRYQVRIDAPRESASLDWNGPGLMTVTWPGQTSGDYLWAYYNQPGNQLWDLMERVAPPPRYDEKNVRYLLYTTGARASWQGTTYKYDSAIALATVRTLLFGAATDAAPPQTQPRVVLIYSVGSKEYEVKVWDDHWAYMGQAYMQPGVFTALDSIRTMGTSTVSP